MLLEEENQTSMRFPQAMNLVFEGYKLLIFQSELFSVKTLHVCKQNPEWLIQQMTFIFFNFLSFAINNYATYNPFNVISFVPPKRVSL